MLDQRNHRRAGLVRTAFIAMLVLLGDASADAETPAASRTRKEVQQAVYS